MEITVLSFSNYLCDIKRISFGVLLLLLTSLGYAQTVTTNKTVTANTSNCGIVNVKVDITGANPITRNSDIILVIDVSGSMGNTISGDTKTSMDYAKLAAKSFITQASSNTNNRIAIVSYTTNAKLEIGLTFLNAVGVTALNAKIDALTATNNTNIQDGIVKAETELETNGRFDCATGRSIILLTDGVANRTGSVGSTSSCSTVSTSSSCVTSAITAATNAKTTVKSSVTYNNQIFSVGLFGGISGNISTVGSDQYVAKYTLDGIQGSPAYITQSGANLTAIYNQIATQISWVAQSLIEKETVIPGFTIGSISVSKGTTSLSGQVITWNTDFLNSETITLNYQLTPTGSACGNQTVSTSTFNYQNASCTNDSKTITSPSYFVPCLPLVTGVLNACGSTTLTASTNAASPTYVWYKDDIVITGQTAATLLVTASGAYKVKVKNGSTNCELTSAASTVTISPAAALVAPDNATISGCSTASITGLIYKTTDTTITLAQLNAAGGSLANSASIGTYTISYSDTASGTCPIVVNRTFKVTTGCGTITKSQTITIQDTSAPTWTTAATVLNVTLQCSDSAGLSTAQNQAPVATDNCGGTVTYTKTSGIFVAGSCANSGTYTNTWIAKDVCLNTSTSFTQVITIQDTSAPTWTTTANSLNTTLQCSDTAGLSTAQNQVPVATDNCGGTVTYTKTSGIFVTGSCANSGTYTNTWIAKDVCLNTSTSFTQVITIQDTSAPTWTTTANSLNTTLQCSDTSGLSTAQNQAPVATDNCGGTVTYTKTSGIFVAGSCANSGTYTNTWIAKDVCLNTSTSFTQVITIQDTSAPTWTTTANSLNVTLQCSDTAGLSTAQNQAPIATDNCGGTVTYTKTSGTFIAGSCANSGTYTNTWIAKDVCLNISATFTQVITIEDTSAPSWTTAATDLNVTLQCSDTSGLSAAQNLAPIATDNCGGTVTYTKTSGIFVAGSCANSGTYTNTWIAKDVCLNTSSTFTQVITIEDTSAPSWTTAATDLNVTLQCSDTSGLSAAQNQAPIATDNCGGTVIYTKTSGIFVAGSCANSGTYTNTWIAKDVCLNTSSTFTQVITIEDNTKPTWSTTATDLNVTLECSDAQGLIAAQALFPAASDLCDADVTNIVKTSGQFVASSSCSNAGTYTNVWTVSDDCGNISDSFTQVITIEDNTKPTWTTAAADLNLTLQCSDTQGLIAAQALFPTASDLCDADVTNIVKTSGQFVASSSCSNAGTYTNVWTVSDDCGNISDSFTQVITIEDTTKPIFIGDLPTDITVSCDAVPEPAVLEVSDNCSGNLPIVFSEVKSNIQNECATNYTLTRTWTTSDCSSNTASYTQIVTVKDTTPPTGTAPADVSGLESIVNIPVANPQDITDAADNCSSNVNITVSDSNNGASGCEGNAYILTRTYTLADCAGNKTDLVQTFTIENKVSVSGIASNVTCFEGNDGSILVTNSPGSTVVITNENNTVVGNTNLPAGTYTLTATSSINNDATCTATATVIITQPTYKVKISGQIINVDTHTPIANVPVTLIPQGTTTGPILLRITGSDGMYNFEGVPTGNYLVQVQDANLNSVYQLYPVNSSLLFTTLEECVLQVHNFEYGTSTLPVLGDYVWYDTNGNGVQDEWYDANNDGVVTKNIPDSEGAVDFSQWEWIDLNGDGSYSGPLNVGELNAGGFGNASSANVIIDGPNGYHADVIVGIEGYWRDRPETANPYGDYTIKLVRDANFDGIAAALGATNLVKVLPSIADKKITAKTNKAQVHTVCQTTTGTQYIVTVTSEDLVHLDADFGVNCKVFADIVANDDNAGPIAGVNHTTTNVLNVLPNDTIEGVVVTASDVIITTVTPNEFLQLNPDGSVDVLSNAPVGTLTLVYQICEADQTSNCDTATVTVTIEAPVMTVTATPICVNDVSYLDYVVTPTNFTPINGVTIAWADSNNNTVTTMTNLPLSGRVLWPGAVVDENGKGIDWPGWLFQNNKWVQGADGFETLRPTANITLSVNPSETITVNYPPSDPYCTARPTFAIVANDDTAGPINGVSGGTNVLNVYNNDTLNNTAINPDDVTLTTVTTDPTGTLTLNPDGSINVAPNTPAGTYTLTYQICENADFGNCDQATVNVTVSSSTIVANDDTYNNIGCNTFGLVGNVLSNDTLNQTPATLQLVNFTLFSENNNTEKTDENISIDASGNVTVSSLTPAGIYTYTYQICEKLNPTNCDTGTITITVLPNGVTNIASEACAEDSSLINLLTLLPVNTPTNGNWIDTNQSNALQGNTLNPFGLALGSYSFEYKIDDENCPRSIILTMEINDDCKVLACGNVVIHNAFSPNGDGINDVFKIDNIDELTCYPGNTVEIYNRWGILVFDAVNYNNTTNAFDGTSRGRTTIKQSDGLPTGTYFYIINYQSLDGNNAVQMNKKEGYLYLSK
ncbi:gliding motility-associated C-terminal domain-containing protein [Flavobacterium sp. ANB]|uniref:HYR-like domain-containing protein n=1 Tax=unclassified Flavobacterium TaxID=196869 RepID=UPI0012B88426|nr:MULTISPECIES: gliding motility-associated C-terminal domain-containing protein [unclassified Flavobacterium]MBF4518414.1 gliding motility-associated C-terminal domain-containing protein [Flavobacterium sp. ANB]MTD70892.1 VWA domain-containing protein [Flavobacterium sp. LC2016-13]